MGDPAVDRAVACVRQAQNADGSWFGRWGVNYIYGTWQSLVGLAAVGVPTDDPAVVAGADWLLAHQQASGGMGRIARQLRITRASRPGPAHGLADRLGVLGLLAAGLRDHPAVVAGHPILALDAEHDGTWDEPEFTGTGFPRVFYLRYHYYPIYFPLLALAQWAGRQSNRVTRAAARQPVRAGMSE